MKERPIMVLLCVLFTALPAWAGTDDIVKERTRRYNMPYVLELGSTHGPGLDFCVVGDSGTGGIIQAEVARVMERECTSFVVHAGDVVYNTGRLKRYEARFVRPYSGLARKNVRFYAIPGNHDYISEDGEAFFAHFWYQPNRYFVLSTSAVDIFMLDSNTLIEGDGDSSQLKWLETMLGASKKRFKVAVLHHPVYSSGFHGDHAALIKTLKPLFNHHGVSLVVSGHEHDYERLRDDKGLVYVVSGGGGAGLRRKRTPDHPFSELFASRYHFLKVETGLFGIKVSAIGADGEVIDTFKAR